MAWSTRQLADLAGVTLRSIRHWHDIGLLPEPERRTNGYKQYDAGHLILALRISRLARLGFPLERVGRMLDSEEHGQQSLHGLRAELDTRIAELHRIRAEVEELIRLGVAPDLSPEALVTMEALGDDSASRNLAIVLTHLIPREETTGLVTFLQGVPEELAGLNRAILDLPAEAAEEEILLLADRAATALKGFLDAHQEALPDLDDSRTGKANVEVLHAVAVEQMNPAQRRVMRLIWDQIATGSPDQIAEPR
ncbi:MerR family DNA-binding transcriptional regulator [Micromonospora sp. NPDC048871]|uniref:MerR family DNA-binding transcriptional regulator n=1 Tax=Micromonospora sp. NPDC048871 TaxID=3364259 RepID=UPI003721C54F